MAERLLFSKLGRARYSSHLDLMRTFQRAFFRAGIPIRHTEGFNPHPYVSIALPLPVGFSSQCEILEFGLEGDVPASELPGRLTEALPEGIVVHSCYTDGLPLKRLAYVRYIVSLEYEGEQAPGAEQALEELLSRGSLVLRKKSRKAKSGYTEVDLIPRIQSWKLERGGRTLTLDALLSAQNPGLNPELICSALGEHAPLYAPAYVSYHRQDLLDGTCKPFR